MIKYIGSKRALLPHLLGLVRQVAPAGARVADLFSGTARVGHALKGAGYRVQANDHTAYAHALAVAYVQADRERWEEPARRVLAELGGLPGRAGYFTQTFCLDARFFRPENGERIDAIRDRIAALAPEPELEAILLVSLMEAADRVDSTAGLQMAYMKEWAPRALKPLELRLPALLPRPAAGACTASGEDAEAFAAGVEADLAYLDPPYNQHSYLANYHIWETLVRWDAPEAYGVARKRVDCRARKSAFNSRPGSLDALARTIRRLTCPTLIVSFNDEGHLSGASIEALLAERGPVRRIEVGHPRYVGARIGIHDPAGRKVGTVGRLRNVECFFVAGEGARLLPETPAAREAPGP